MSTHHPVNTVAKCFNLTPRRVSQLASDGIIPRPENGQYHLLNCFRGYVKYLQSKPSGVASEQKYRKRLLKGQVDKIELEVKTLSKEMISVDQAIADWSNMVLTFRAKILALPYRAATMSVGLKGVHEIEKVIKTLIYEALNELAHYDPNSGDSSDIRIDAKNENTETEGIDEAATI